MKINNTHLTACQTKEMFLAVASRIIASENFLTEIDRKIGDGDHGIAMATGFSEVAKALHTKTVYSVEEVLLEVGNTLLDNMGGASGALFGTMFISGIVGRQQSPSLDIAGFAHIFRQALEAIKTRGKAQIGDKTMVDAMEPAVIALEECARLKLNVVQSFSRAAAEARRGVEESREYLARFGRAKSYGDAALGCQDAGATSVWLIFQAMTDWASENLNRAAMISTITLNPCIDRTIEIDHLREGGSNNVLSTREDISGKGINVSLVLKQLGRSTTCLGFNSTATPVLKDFLNHRDIPHNLIDVPGRLRINTKIFDHSNSCMSEFNETGAPVPAQSLEELRQAVAGHIPASDIIVVNGSVPPGVPPEIYHDIIKMAKDAGKISILDASGDLLRQAVKAGPFLVKPNLSELNAAYNLSLCSREEVIAAAQLLIKQGATYVCVSMADKGAVLVSENRVCFAKAVNIDVRGVQGAGDSMVAGFCMALEDGVGFCETLKYAMAAAHGSLIHEGTILCGLDDFKKMLELIDVVEI